MHVPTVGESITEVTLATWLKEDGDHVSMDDIIAEVDSDKATFELPAEATGILRQVAKEGDTLEIGGLICKIEVTDGSPEENKEQTPEKSSEKSDPAESKKEETYAAGHASPAASKILAEKDIDPKSITGTGKDGRITKEDALKAEQPKAAPTAGKSATPEKSKAEEPAAEGKKPDRAIAEERK